jgi:hypothetical protein
VALNVPVVSDVQASLNNDQVAPHLRNLGATCVRHAWLAIPMLDRWLFIAPPTPGFIRFPYGRYAIGLAGCIVLTIVFLEVRRLNKAAKKELQRWQGLFGVLGVALAIAYTTCLFFYTVVPEGQSLESIQLRGTLNDAAKNLRDRFPEKFPADNDAPLVAAFGEEQVYTAASLAVAQLILILLWFGTLACFGTLVSCWITSVDYPRRPSKKGISQGHRCY